MNKTPHLSRLALAIAAALSTMQASANPTGGEVVSGNASIQSSGNQTTINQSSNRAIINWQSFSIQQGETTRFIQPSSSSAVLNRVVTGNPSAILGNLSSNGQVFLINPNGVLVGNGATINTGAFFASTRDVINQQFMNGGNLDFFGSSNASVVNLGTINATSGDVVLLAYQVSNEGSITAPAGTVALASAKELLYAPTANDRVLVKASALKDSGNVNNAGTIAAAQVELKAAGGNPYALAVNAGGSISAISLDQVGGKIVLNAKSGTTQVSGDLTAKKADKGGEIIATGQHVALTETAKLDASGPNGGGRIAVGGGYQGKDAALQNAETTTIAKGARLSADAASKGNGGQITVWANDTTRYQGHASVRGGANGGDGGFIEVSGKKSLGYAGTVDMRAIRGKNGKLLLDPTDITINDDAPGGSLAVAGNTSTVTATDIRNALMMGNVVISTSSAGGGFGDISFASVGNASAYLFDGIDNTLTLQAERDITVNQSVRVFNFAPTSTNAGLTLEAGRNLTVNGSSTYLWSNNLTLVADAANHGNGTSTMKFADGVNLFGDNIRLFVPGKVQLTAPSSVSVSSNADTFGKYYGDAGTDAAGIYYKNAISRITLTPQQQFWLISGEHEQFINASGDTVLIEWLKIFNAAKEKLKQNPGDETASKIADRMQQEILKHLPDDDPTQAARLATVKQYNDSQLNEWMNEIAQLEREIMKNGRTDSLVQRIATLKRKVDLGLMGKEFDTLMATLDRKETDAVSGVGTYAGVVRDRLLFISDAWLENSAILGDASTNEEAHQNFGNRLGGAVKDAMGIIQAKLDSRLQSLSNNVSDLDRQIAEQDRKINQALEDYNKRIGGDKNLAASSWGTGASTNIEDTNLQNLYDQKEALLRQKSEAVGRRDKFSAQVNNFKSHASSISSRLEALINAANGKPANDFVLPSTGSINFTLPK
jgi:filamentous hemagglutinin family protein